DVGGWGRLTGQKDRLIRSDRAVFLGCGQKACGAPIKRAVVVVDEVACDRAAGATAAKLNGQRCGIRRGGNIRRDRTAGREDRATDAAGVQVPGTAAGGYGDAERA